MKFLFTDSHTGKLSSSKIWTHISYGVATYVVIKSVDGTTNWEMLLVYMAVVGGSEIAKKILTLNNAANKYEAKVDKKE